MPTYSPSKEACDAIVDALNASTDFDTQFTACYVEFPTEDLGDGETLSVEVVHEDEEQLQEMLQTDYTRHTIVVQVTGRCRPGDDEATEEYKKLAADIKTALDQWDSSDGRVSVWYVADEPVSDADKQALREMNLFRRNVKLTVEVAP